MFKKNLSQANKGNSRKEKLLRILIELLEDFIEIFKFTFYFIQEL